MPSTEDAGTADARSSLPKADEIRKIIELKRMEKVAAANKRRLLGEVEEKHQKETFLSNHLTPELIAQLTSRVRAAAENEGSEIMIGSFPASWCTDRGRRINVAEDDWPDTLQGIAREYYDFWAKELKPRGYKLRVGILNYPNGLPGDVGAFLSW